jgi:hypothetical protein
VLLAAHIDFDAEARDRLPKADAQHGFTWEATTDWSRLSATRRDHLPGRHRPGSAVARLRQTPSGAGAYA